MRPGANACSQCGVRVAICSQCGDLGLSDDRFCARCGGSRHRSGATTPRPSSLGPIPTVTPAGSVHSGGGERPSAVRAEATWTNVLDRLREATLGEYDIAGEVGRGGMAAVYLAHDIALNRKVAIKVMSPLLLLGEGMLDRFRREAQVVARLTHPSIVTIHAIKETNGLNFIVMKYIEGGSLEAILHQAAPLPLPMVRSILAQVGSALAYAHRHGVVHRDVKPGNILVDVEGDAVVSDFGIAKVAAESSMTHAGDAVGTPAYMSPEQCESLEISPASDQYSLGIVAFELLTGTLPFQGSKLTIMRGHVEQSPPSITSLREDCPKSLQAAVSRMLEKKPAHRWPSVADAIAALGAGALGPQDPVRTQLGQLASGNLTADKLREIRTPVSVPPRPAASAGPMDKTAEIPVPRGRRMGLLSPRTKIGIGAGAVVLFGLLLFLVFRTPKGGSKTAPQPTPAGKASIVLPSGGDLAQAMQMIAAAGTIRLLAGQYALAAPLRIAKSLSIVGAGADSTRIVASSTIAVGLADGQHLVLTGVAVDYAGQDPVTLLTVESGDLRLTDVRLKGVAGGPGACDRVTGAGLLLGSQASATVSGSTISSNCRGLVSRGTGTVTIAKSSFVDNQVAGIIVDSSSAPEISGNRIQGSRFGIWYMGSKGGLAAVNEITKNSGDGVMISAGEPTLRSNRLDGNSGFQVTTCDGSHPKLDRIPSKEVNSLPCDPPRIP